MTADKLTRNFKLAYGSGQFAFGAMSYAMAIFLLFYYNQVLGLSSGLTGLAIGLALIVDAFSDPLVGSVSDNWRSRYGRRHPFLYASILPAAISLFFLFNPLVTSDLGLVIWLVIFSNATRTAMSLFNVPHISLGAEISEDFDERSELAAYRMFFQYAGSLFVLVVGFYFFFASTPEFQNGQLNAAAYPRFALMLSILVAVSIFLTAWGTRSIVPSLTVPPEGPRVSLVETLFRVIADVRSAVRSRSFRWFVAGNLTIFVIVGVNASLDLYIFTYFWEFESEEVLLVIIAYPIGLMLGAPFAPRVIGRFDKRAVLALGTLAWGVWQMLPVSLRLLNLFPENGSVTLIPLLIGLKLIQGVCTVQSDVAAGALVADIADENELESGKRQEGIFFAAMSFSWKATSGVGSVVAGLALELINWPAGSHIQSAADIPPETLVKLGVIYGPLIASLTLVTVWCYLHLDLSRQKHEATLTELAKRRTASQVD